MNLEIARIFYEIADMLELKNDKWRPQAYRIAAQTLESLKKDVEDIYLESGIKGLEELPGVGQALAKKIIEFIETGKINRYEELKTSIPSGLFEMMKIPGVGVKKARLFYEKKITTIKKLIQACQKHKLQGIEGFKERAEEKILEGISLVKTETRIPLKQGEKIAIVILKELKKLKEVKEAVIGGSIRRKKETIRDIDIVVLTNKPKIVADKFVKMNFVDKVIGKGEEKATIISQGRQVDIRMFNEEEFGAGLLYFTGDKQHNIWLRKIAIKNSWKLNEYGLFDIKTGKRIAGRSEEEIYKKLGVKYTSPEKRIGEVG